MNKYEFNATNLIAETFENLGVGFDVVNHSGQEQLMVSFPVVCGPSAIARFVSCGNGNGVAIRIFSLVSNTPKEKRTRVMEACNMLNQNYRCMKFYIDSDGDINADYDFLECSPDDGVGEMAFEILIRLKQVLDSEYNIFMKALYSDDNLDIQGSRVPSELMQRLQELRKIMESRMIAVGTFNSESDEAKLSLEDLDLLGSFDGTAY